MSVDTYFTHNTISRDLLGIVTGKKLGDGVAREVYRCELRPDLVLKFETAAKSFQNVMEWQTWQEVAESPALRAWFAPCRHISACGSILAMDFAESFTGLDDKRLPTEVPAHFTDLKIENWGMIKGRPVCIDYGTSLCMSVGLTKRMRKAQWWSHS